MKKVSKLSGTVGIEKFGSPPATLAKSPTLGTVSYTHLTLPTMLMV